MDKAFLFIKGSNFSDVRMQKYFAYFKCKNIPAYFWGWDRDRTADDDKAPNVKHIFHGGGYGTKKLPLLYCLWMVILFFRILFLKNIRNYNIVAVNFDAVIPICFASFFRRFSFVYELLDEFALSYNFPGPVKRFVRALDHLAMRRADFVIHVDANRVNYDKCKYIIIENAPFDFYEGTKKKSGEMQHAFAVTGLLTNIRGMDSIFQFAHAHPELLFLMIGPVRDARYEQLLREHSNIRHYPFMDQRKLFEIIHNCAGIFSLYAPTSEINRLAASNKVYDAMMLGIPVITNREVLNAAFIEKNRFGVIVDYTCNESWNCLASQDYLQKAVILGRNGRALYLQKYRFDVMLEERFLPMFVSDDKNKNRSTDSVDAAVRCSAAPKGLDK